MYSAAVSSKDLLAVSVLDSSSAESIVKVYSSSDHASSFSTYAFPPQEKQITSSRIFSTAKGGFILFISLGEGRQNPMESSFSILYSESSDGKKWSDLRSFRPSEKISNALSPYYAVIQGKEFVFFEGWLAADPTSSMIYASSRSSSSSSWSEAFIVSGEDSLSDISLSYSDFKNFRPYVLSDGISTKMVWERTSKTENTASVMVAPIGPDGKILDRNDVESLNAFGNGRRPSLFLFKGKFFALWFDDRNGVNNVHLSENLGVQWVELDSVVRRQNSKSDCAFPCVLLNSESSESLSIVWQQELNGSTRVVQLKEDFFAEKPQISPRNFKAGKHGNIKNPSVKVVLSQDISGLNGYTAIWTTNPEEEPETDVMSAHFHLPDSAVIKAEIPEDADGDKIVYFKAKTLDKAGNWSETAVVEYYYDCTPPEQIVEVTFDKDEFGFASSNDVSFSWTSGENEASDIAGYSWSLTRIAPLSKNLAVSKTKRLSISKEEAESILAELVNENESKIQKSKVPAEKIMGNAPSVSFRNRDNGLYVFSVRAIDSVGNAGQVYQIPLFLNKYKAATLISSVKATPDDFGNVAIDISGQEFSYDGYVSQVIITDNSSGEKHVFNQKDFEVKKMSGDNESITGIKIDGMHSGSYKVQIRHSERGLSAWPSNLLIGENGTVKYEKPSVFEPLWRVLEKADFMYSLDSRNLLFGFVLFLVALGIAVCTGGLLSAAGDMIKIRSEVDKILKGEYMNRDQLEQAKSNIKVKISLRIKFGISITALLLFIVAGVAFAIGFQMSNTQEKILIAGLRDRVSTVMGNMASGCQTYLDDGREKLTEIGSIVNQIDNFAEAKNATILSFEIDGHKLSDGSFPMDYVWATNDTNINSKIKSKEFDAGTVRYVISENFYDKYCFDINSSARKIVETVSAQTDKKDELDRLIFQKLNELSSSQYTSYPAMPSEKLDRNALQYKFFWPVLYQRPSDNSRFLQAMIIVEVSTDTLVKQVDNSRLVVMSISLVAAVIAALIGLISAFSLSSIIVSPIQKIVSHVKRITETEDKLLLEGVEIKITSHDELRTLGDSVNEMTKGLVKGAKDEERAKIAYQRAAKEREKAARAQAEEAKARAESAEMNIMNLDGQAVQKAFIPLVSSGAEKSTTAELKEKDIQVYGYYEGTDAVSGDYFDYKKLDDRWYAFIKCDASGHGVPAALIMTIVATIFRRYFADWKFEKKGVKLNLLAADINDFIESLGLRGKFAAMMICLLDTKTGDVYTCNAGDNILRVFDCETRKIKVITLHEAPAAGPLPSFMVEMKGGYKVEKIKLKKNDVLFLYTDGIEESTRFFRNADYEVIACDEPGLKEGEVHDTHKKGEQSEQMEPKRVQDIIEAVLNKKKYVLKRYHAPLADEKLEFDFTRCEGTIEEAIIALTAVEKVFRMYKKPGSSGKVEKTEMDLDGKKKTVIQVSGDGIKIDRKIDAFLAKYFNLYDYYCVNKVDEDEANYVYYTGVSEDVQADDLTLLAIKRM